MAILFHPAHRKFIRLLRSHADKGTIINVTDVERKRFLDLFQQTENAKKRHMSAYKLLLEILNRSSPSDEGCLFTHEMVNYIETVLAHAERRKPWMTFLGTVFVPLLRFVLGRRSSSKKKR